MDTLRCDIEKLNALLAISDGAAKHLHWFDVELRNESRKAHEPTNQLHLSELYRFTLECRSAIENFENLPQASLPCLSFSGNRHETCYNKSVLDYLEEVQRLYESAVGFWNLAKARVLDISFFHELAGLVSQMCKAANGSRKAIMKTVQNTL